MTILLFKLYLKNEEILVMTKKKLPFLHDEYIHIHHVQLID